MRKIVSLSLAAAALAVSPLQAAPAPKPQAVLESKAYRAAAKILDRDHDRMVAEIITLTEIPAPPFKEAARAAAYRDMLKEAGLADVEIDAEGNAIGVYRGTGPAGGSAVMIAAHLDTVFPEGTPVKVRREGTRLHAPGIGDDTRGLAVLLAYARAMKESGVKVKQDIIFVGNVGEEGPGDLRGVRHLLTKGKYKDRVKAFFSMDGLDPSRLVTGGVGSKRYRITWKGPGGHSFSAFGLVNPMTAMSQAVVDLYKIQVPAQPRTTYAASVTGGGTSVNSIPNEAYMEFDMRSESPAELAKLEQAFLGVVRKSVESENTARSVKEGPITADIKLIGDRPAGETAATQPIVQNAQAIIRANGLKPISSFSSTDSNLPMSLGIPAVTIGSGGEGGRAHALDEWIDVEKTKSLSGAKVGLGILLATAGVQ
ncbi:peptidase M20 [Sphingopyxis sp. H050]|jgi:tripeptide aminopeptidase|uniref:M20/M25/M40 family metallo-hydrolase n=1 Tax=Sphingopyxis sp. H050 TaxID=1759072 RepID=UPI0007374D4F|nr:M20/M25/M40 family metallo-hydrolase [Sphingopyxis sp. H050]KTE21303.1 peptidase M20 [Sphingopyxis sp. H050]